MSEWSGRILFATGAVYVYTLRIAFDLARGAGCEGVELDLCPEAILRGPRAVARLAAAAGLPVRAVHPPLFPLPRWTDLGTIVPGLVELALAVQAPVIVLHPPRALHVEGERVRRFVRLVGEARRRLEGTGTRIVLENPGRFRPCDSDYPLWHLPALHRLAQECDLPMALDTAHAGAVQPLLEAYALVRDRLAHLHLSDARVPPPHLDRAWLYSYVKHHQLPGEGVLPLQELLGALGHDGYRGDIALELSPVSLGIWSLRRARRRLSEAVQWTRRMMQP